MTGNHKHKIKRKEKQRCVHLHWGWGLAVQDHGGRGIPNAEPVSAVVVAAVAHEKYLEAVSLLEQQSRRQSWLFRTGLRAKNSSFQSIRVRWLAGCPGLFLPSSGMEGKSGH